MLLGLETANSKRSLNASIPPFIRLLLSNSYVRDSLVHFPRPVCLYANTTINSTRERDSFSYVRMFVYLCVCVYIIVEPRYYRVKITWPHILRLIFFAQFSFTHYLFFPLSSFRLNNLSFGFC